MGASIRQMAALLSHKSYDMEFKVEGFCVGVGTAGHHPWLLVDHLIVNSGTIAEH